MPKLTEALRKYRRKANPQATDDPIRIAWETEMMYGYLDGRKADNPEPSGNRRHSYRHGFANGRDDLVRRPRAAAAILRTLAEEAIDKDIEASPSRNSTNLQIMPKRPGARQALGDQATGATRSV